MRLKCYSAPSMAEAMALIRQELGDDAVIVSTQRAAGDGGIRITAAIEVPDNDGDLRTALAEEFGQARAAEDDPRVVEVEAALSYHGVPVRLADRILTLVHSAETEALDGVGACAAALDAIFPFAPLPERKSPRPFLICGPPGVGKTISVAKLAARARLSNRPVGVISADSVRAGAMAQLAAFTRILEVDLKRARGPESLRALVEDSVGVHDLVFIDSPGINPFSRHDTAFLKELIEAADVEPILVLAAGIDPMEGAEAGESFAKVGATRLLATRLDMARRLGGILAAADQGQLMFSEVTISPHVANGLIPIHPQSLARLILPRPSRETRPAAPVSTSAVGETDAAVPSVAEAAR
ncbi:GTP-binding protein [Roseospira marina]|uniref:Flagellar biosynthesis protein FlhF n=1 Tax=Roseospira marina TaxID=140057 RepID=A0A5M6IDB6_9PROT|nr:GTP-binding protein [Roseospira marina]KAA5605725.1 GTP-binding protein [Roseospira marina]MBB4313526.1 flagellar biosynthesis protein FlhF [Roseospira marina]MBB5086688.1 flagellar biosynthesis protein FlhF [Roseospira marina]